MSGGDLPVSSAIGLVRVGLQTACDNSVGLFAFQFGPWVGESENDRATITMIPVSFNLDYPKQHDNVVLATKTHQVRFELWDATFDLMNITESFLLTNLKLITKNWVTLDDMSYGNFAHDQWGFKCSWTLGFKENLNKYQPNETTAIVNAQLGRYKRNH